MLLAVIVYFLIAVYIAQNTCLFDWHTTPIDKWIEFGLAVFWLPAAIAAAIL
jgi:hypothetical protein